MSKKAKLPKHDDSFFGLMQWRFGEPETSGWYIALTKILKPSGELSHYTTVQLWFNHYRLLEPWWAGGGYTGTQAVAWDQPVVAYMPMPDVPVGIMQAVE